MIQLSLAWPSCGQSGTCTLQVTPVSWWVKPINFQACQFCLSDQGMQINFNFVSLSSFTIFCIAFQFSIPLGQTCSSSFLSHLPSRNSGVSMVIPVVIVSIPLPQHPVWIESISVIVWVDLGPLDISILPIARVRGLHSWFADGHLHRKYNYS